MEIYNPESLNDDNTVKLGMFDTSRQITWEQTETRNFIERLIRYAIIRDKFREKKKSNIDKNIKLFSIQDV